jgi:hypothetical protein
MSGHMPDRFAGDELFEVEVDHDFVSANVERCLVSVDVPLHTDTSLGSEHLKRPPYYVSEGPTILSGH